MKQRLRFVLTTTFTLILAAVMGANSELKAQCVSLTTFATYTEDFNTLANNPNGGTSSIMPAGWALAESGTNANGTYSIGTGTSTAGDTYSFGSAAGNTDRALGTQTSGSLTPARIGACFTNNTGGTITSVQIQYTGEQWRGGSTTADKLTFHYSTDATDLINGTFVASPNLDFNSIINGDGSTGAGQLNGNLDANRAAITASFDVTVPHGGTLWIRWTDSDVLGSDHGMAVDEFSMTPVGTTATSANISGRIRTADGTPLSNVTVKISGGGLSEPIYATSNNFGNYGFAQLPVGQSYTLTVFGKKYSFVQSTIIVELNGNVSDADFTAENH